tara:strand:+ start:106 stop:450 length:345 start_codon:yes stop_codon:yes gene_type:complete
MTDHRVSITTAADEYTTDAREEFERGEFEPLDVAVWRRADMPDVYQVEFLLSCGGPTVRVTIDECDGVTFFHSWGKAAADDDAPDRTRCDWMPDRLADFWRGLAAEYAEMMPAE